MSVAARSGCPKENNHCTAHDRNENACSKARWRLKEGWEAGRTEVMAFDVTVPGVPLGDPVYSTLHLSFQSSQVANLAIQLLGQIYDAAGPPFAATTGQQLTVADDNVTTISGSNPTQTTFE